MLRMINLPSNNFNLEFADQIEYGLKKTVEDVTNHTVDLGGN